MTRTLHSRGVSLIEALVALAVMSFGMLGVVGMQATLRYNADVSKQRSEAVRLAQEEVERWRSFSVLETTAGQLAYADITTAAAAAVALPASANATYTRSTTVALPVAGGPDVRSVTVMVQWLDRRSSLDADAQTVSLNTQIAGIAPELAGSLGLPGDQAATHKPRGRHSSIPMGALDQPGGSTSSFTPPGGGTVVWVFNNATGQITKICTVAESCTATNAWLLSGYVQFATGTAPTLTEAETPNDPVPGTYTVGVVVDVTAPSASTQSCYTAAGSTSVAYYCLVPTPGFPRQWSGRSRVTGLPVASNLSDYDGDVFKVCRYTPEMNDTPSGGNSEHPLDYVNVAGPLTNQNFLVITAGDDLAVSFTCPSGTPSSSSLVNSNTWRHQPIT